MKPAIIRPIAPSDRAGLLALNNAHAVETSWLEQEGFGAILRQSFMAACIGEHEAMLIALQQDAAYRSVNFLWFRERLARFVYVDRVITAAAARGRGHARRLYEALFARALVAGHERVVCEVNLAPPNPASARLHAALGFEEIGRASLGQGGKRVQYLSRRLIAR